MSTTPSTEQLLVQVLMRSAQQVLGAMAEFPDDAPEREHAQHVLELTFPPIWSRIPFLTLACLDDSLGWEGHIVLTPEEDEYDFAGTLVTSGIHGFTLVPGAERTEMIRFLELIDKKRRLDEDGDQDLVLMLFRADLNHIRYSVGSVVETPIKPVGSAPPTMDLVLGLAEESGTSMRPGEPETIDASELHHAVRVDAETPDRRRGVVELEKFDSTLYFLDQKEIEYLRTAIDREYSQDHSLSVLALLLDIVQLRPEPEVRDEVIGILKNLLPYLLGTGRFESVAYLTNELRKITRETELDAAHKEALNELRVSISEAGVLSQLFYVLDDGEVEPTSEELGILLREMSHQAMQTVLVWIGQLKRPKAKTALIKAIEDFFRQWPTALTRMTSASDRTVVHRALAIAHKLCLPDFTEAVGDVLESDDATTRRLAVDALSSIGTPAAFRYLARAVDDPDAAVRTSAYRALTVRPYRGALKGLRAWIDSGEIESCEISERKALFSAFGAVAGAEGVSVLEPIIMGKGGFGRRPSSGTRACAALALGIINTPTARFALEAASTDRDAVVRSAASSALRDDGVGS